VNYPYPDFIDKPFHPGVDEYPYPEAAQNITFDGLHPSDKGYEQITKSLVKILNTYNSAISDPWYRIRTMVIPLSRI